MIDKILKGVIGLVGALMGFSILTLFVNLGIVEMSRGGWLNLIIHLGVSILFGIIFFSLSSRMIDRGRKLVKLIENELEKFSAYDITISSVGLIVGLVIAFLLSQPLNSLGIPYIGVIASIILYSMFGYLGLTIPHRKRDDISSTLGNIKRSPKDKTKTQNRVYPKILDTSVIIDGRIADICKTGFIEGPLIIPEFVLEELHQTL